MEAPFTQAQSEAYLETVRFCSYRERSRQELEQKLQRLQLPQEQWDAVLERLAAEGFQDEQRYARAFATDKARLSSWGPLKIRQGLRRKGVPDALIDAALEQLDADSLQERLDHLLRQKDASLRNRREALAPMEHRARLQRYALGRGFGHDAVRKALDRLGA
jgi:regulatory protein